MSNQFRKSKGGSGSQFKDNSWFVGVTPRLFIEKGVDDKRCDEMIVTDGMRDRKAAMPRLDSC